MAAKAASRAASGRGGTDAMRMAAVRRYHTYLGALIAPSVLFFAATGAVQLFSLHEAHGGYVPPPLIEKLSAVHKDQVFAAKAHKARPAAKTATGASGAHDHDHDDEAGPPLKTVLLKWTFLAVSLGLIVSTGLGLWMAFTTARRKGLVLILLILGAAAPVLILALG
jgi:hypothetical protein